MLATDLIASRKFMENLPFKINRFRNRVSNIPQRNIIRTQDGGIIDLIGPLSNFITAENAIKFGSFILPIVASFILKKVVSDVNKLSEKEQKNLSDQLQNITEDKLDKLLDLIEDKIDDIQEEEIDDELEDLISDKSKDILIKIISGTGINFI